MGLKGIAAAPGPATKIATTAGAPLEYATMMLMAGMRPAFCAGQMGHSVEIFLRTYAKWIPGAGDMAEMAKLEAQLKGTGT